MINSIPGFLVFPTQGNVSRIYADTYSQEDRLKHLADLLQRMMEWQKASVEKINEIADVVNNSGTADLAGLDAAVHILKAEMIAVQGHILNLNSEISELTGLPTAVEDIENSIADLISAVSEVEEHTLLTDNPHSVTKAQVGLGNVADIAPADLPVSSATASALAGKASEEDVTELKSETITVVAHGANASTPRPAGVGAVLWQGAVEPANKIAGDIWAEVS